MNDLSKARLLAGSLTVYRSLLSNETVSRFLRLLQETESGDTASFCVAYGSFVQSLADQNSELNFSEHLESLVRYDDNAFSRMASAENLRSNQLLSKAAERDLETLHLISSLSSVIIKKSLQLDLIPEEIKKLPDYIADSSSFFGGQKPNGILETITKFYRESGYGIFARFGAFRWNGKLVGIPYPDPVRLTELKEYDYERGLVAANTLDFVEGRGGGNLLLYGDRGTGKSSTVKALANEYRSKGLRIVEISRDCISDLPTLLEYLRNVPQKFLLFLDDLTFSTDDESFSALKSILEGGVVSRPENCRVYATSNRRHLVKESFAERDVDDVHAGDTMQEKLSLYDRFDQTINFFAPDQARYLAIVRALAMEHKLTAPFEELDRGAVQWAIRAGGRSPRTAKQYVEWAYVQCQKGASLHD